MIRSSVSSGSGLIIVSVIFIDFYQKRTKKKERKRECVQRRHHKKEIEIHGDSILVDVASALFGVRFFLTSLFFFQQHTLTWNIQKHRILRHRNWVPRPSKPLFLFLLFLLYL
jgi:hypothetical protein